MWFLAAIILAFIFIGVEFGAGIAVLSLIISLVVTLIFYANRNTIGDSGVETFFIALFKALTAPAAAFALFLIAGQPEPGLTIFMIADLIALTAIIILEKKTVKEIDAALEEPLKQIQAILQDCSHFMVMHHRHTEFFVRDGKTFIELSIFDPELARISYREYERANLDPTEYFFGDYRPTSGFSFLFYDLFEKGTVDDYDSLSYEYSYSFVTSS